MHDTHWTDDGKVYFIYIIIYIVGGGMHLLQFVCVPPINKKEMRQCTLFRFAVQTRVEHQCGRLLQFQRNIFDCLIPRCASTTAYKLFNIQKCEINSYRYEKQQYLLKKKIHILHPYFQHLFSPYFWKKRKKSLECYLCVTIFLILTELANDQPGDRN